jgi:hypothetical protein
MLTVVLIGVLWMSRSSASAAASAAIGATNTVVVARSPEVEPSDTASTFQAGGPVYETTFADFTVHGGRVHFDGVTYGVGEDTPRGFVVGVSKSAVWLRRLGQDVMMLPALFEGEAEREQPVRVSDDGAGGWPGGPRPSPPAISVPKVPSAKGYEEWLRQRTNSVPRLPALRGL